MGSRVQVKELIWKKRKDTSAIRRKKVKIVICITCKYGARRKFIAGSFFSDKGDIKEIRA